MKRKDTEWLNLICYENLHMLSIEFLFILLRWFNLRNKNRYVTKPSIVKKKKILTNK